MTDGIWLDEPFYIPPQCAIPHCLEPVDAVDLCRAHLAEFKEWLRRKAWREANVREAGLRQQKRWRGALDKMED